MSGKRQYKQPTRAQMAQIEEKKRIQQQANANSSSSSGMPGTHNVITTLHVLVFERESKQLLRAVSPQEFNEFVKGLDMKPSELETRFFILPMPLMESVKDHLEEWMREGKSGKQEKIEVDEPELEEEDDDPIVPMSPGVTVSEESESE